jgi:hypothetical protein
MRKSESLTDELFNDNNLSKKRKCGEGILKCVGIILFCGFSLGLSFYSGISYSNYLNDNSVSF